tara:strand:- start:5231 stop:5452 length:222 start_codon:yes stop_codon:yes gene_type:complete
MTTKKKDNKPGYLTTEFALSSICALLGIAIAGGWVDPSGTGTADKIVGAVCGVLAALGYTVSRTILKKSAGEK